MFVEREEHDPYRGLNPSFVKRVLEKRREAARLANAMARTEEKRRRMEAIEAEIAARAKAKREHSNEMRRRRAGAQRRMEEKRSLKLEEKSLRAAAMRRALDEAAAQMEHKHPVKPIIQRVAEECGFDALDLIGPSRKRPVIAARFLAIRAVADARPDLSRYQIGQYFGGRDPTTILHAMEQTRAPGQLR